MEAARSGAASTHAGADREIQRIKQIIAEIDHLEDEMEKMKRIRKVVKDVRDRADQLAARYEAAHRSSHSHGHGQTRRR